MKNSYIILSKITGFLIYDFTKINISFHPDRSDCSVLVFKYIIRSTPKLNDSNVLSCDMNVLEILK